MSDQIIFSIGFGLRSSTLAPWMVERFDHNGAPRAAYDAGHAIGIVLALCGL